MKSIYILFFTVVNLLVFAQPNTEIKKIDAPAEIQSSIIDHSDVQKIIESHAIVAKKKPFIEGYRIQIFNSNNREEATASKTDFYSKFPSMRCYTVYQQPYYKVRVGDYPNPESAKGDLKKLAKFYPSSFLVPEQIRRVEKEEDESKKN